MRIYFGGEGDHIPPIALPDPHAGDAVPIILLPDNGELFKPGDYIGLGYNYYQAWCVGGSGGYGASVSDKYSWVSVDEARYPGGLGTYQRLMTTDEWNAYVAMFTQPYYQILDPAQYDPITGGYHLVGREGHMPWIYITPAEYAEYCNPAHICIVRQHLYPIIGRDSLASYAGGAPGGGGLHVMTGRLDELPEEVLCTIGGAGDNAPKALSRSGVDINANAEFTEWFDYSRGSYVDEFPLGVQYLHAPARGADGGASSFGEVCKASGGGGGWPATIFDPAHPNDRYYHARGGDGGLGGRTAVGGGALGAYDLDKSDTARDGTWDPNSGIGQGGGGGHGGFQKYPPLPPGMPLGGLGSDISGGD